MPRLELLTPEPVQSERHSRYRTIAWDFSPPRANHGTSSGKVLNGAEPAALDLEHGFRSAPMLAV